MHTDQMKLVCKGDRQTKPAWAVKESHLTPVDKNSIIYFFT